MAHKLTLKGVLEQFKKIHGDFYDYSKVKYGGYNETIYIVCPVHGEFKTTPRTHKKGHGCAQCYWDSKKDTRETVLAKFKHSHGDFYNYSEMVYVNQDSKVCVKCLEHGEFWIAPKHHISGSGCPKCSGRGLTIVELVKTFKEAHKDQYDYSKVEYTNYHKPISVICPTHGVFEVLASKHKLGRGCPHCGYVKQKTSLRKTTKNRFLNRVEKECPSYNFSKFNYMGNFVKGIVICSTHGEFLISPSHLYRGQGCSRCKQSGGERRIDNKLVQLGISFITEKTFKKCVDKQALPFDFYLPNYNICIEFDGKQHFYEFPYYGGAEGFALRKKHDTIKNEFCKNNNIVLLRVPYWEFKNIDEILENKLGEITYEK